MSREQSVCVMGIACPPGTFATSERPLQGVRGLLLWVTQVRGVKALPRDTQSKRQACRRGSPS